MEKQQSQGLDCPSYLLTLALEALGEFGVDVACLQSQGASSAAAAASSVALECKSHEVEQGKAGVEKEAPETSAEDRLTLASLAGVSQSSVDASLSRKRPGHFPGLQSEALKRSKTISIADGDDRAHMDVVDEDGCRERERENMSDLDRERERTCQAHGNGG